MPDHGSGPRIPDARPAAPRVRRLLARHRATGGTHAAERRVAGIHRAQGLAGTPWRYAAIVAFLVATASLPVLAAITAGSATLADDGAGQTTPFLAEEAQVPAVIVPWVDVPVGPTLGRPEPTPVATTSSAGTPRGRSEHRPGPAPSRPAIAPARADGTPAPPRLPEITPVPTPPGVTPVPTPPAPAPGLTPPRLPGWTPPPRAPGWKPPHPPGKAPAPPHRDPTGRRPIGCGHRGGRCVPVAPSTTTSSSATASPLARCGRTRRRPERGR
ncbi:MAG TPA: hypothetical protein VGJ63_11695 [Micromonosporaceae bacterium]